MSGSPNIIDKAIDRLRGRWLQGSSSDGKGNVCAVGAIAAVSINDRRGWSAEKSRLYWRACDLVDAVTRRETEGQFPNVAHFNDHRSTSEEDVILMLKKASAGWDESA